MKRKSIKVLLILVMLSNIVLGQNEIIKKTNNYLGYKLGSNWIKEELLIPKVHKGSINGLTYRFEKDAKNFHTINLYIGYGKLITDFEKDKKTEKVTWNGQIYLDYSMGFKLLNIEKVQYFLGLNTKYSWSIMEYPVWDESRAYWSTSLSIAPYNRLIVVLKNNHKLITTYDLSLLGILSRPDEVRLYAQEEWSLLNIISVTNSDLKFGSINSILISNLRTEYRIPMKNDHYFSFSYTMIYSKTKKCDYSTLFITRNYFSMGIGF